MLVAATDGALRDVPIADKGAGVAPDLAGVTPSAGSAKKAIGKDAWQRAVRKVQVGLALSHRLTTLRDQHGINEIEISELKPVKLLGEGAFATVEQRLYTSKAGGAPYMVAIKKLKPHVVSHEDDLDSFLAEVALMRKLKHKHIVDYIGIGSVDKSSESKQRGTMFLVTELMDAGTLHRLLTLQMTHKHMHFYSDASALRWCAQIASALAYLHKAKPIVIHRDLKPANILLKGGKDRATQDAKLADFGLAAFMRKQSGAEDALPPLPSAPVSVDAEDHLEELDRKTNEMLNRLTSIKDAQMSAADAAAATVADPVDVSVTLKAVDELHGEVGTLFYMAPEMYRGETYNEKVDVFAFSLIMYEILHRYMLVFTVVEEGASEAEITQYVEKVSGGWRPPLSDKIAPEVLSIIRDAWAQNPDDRPSMQQIYDRLQSIRALPVFAEAEVVEKAAALAKQTAHASGGCGCIIS